MPRQARGEQRVSRGRAQGGSCGPGRPAARAGRRPARRRPNRHASCPQPPATHSALLAALWASSAAATRPRRPAGGSDMRSGSRGGRTAGRARCSHAPAQHSKAPQAASWRRQAAASLAHRAELLAGAGAAAVGALALALALLPLDRREEAAVGGAVCVPHHQRAVRRAGLRLCSGRRDNAAESCGLGMAGRAPGGVQGLQRSRRPTLPAHRRGP